MAYNHSTLVMKKLTFMMLIAAFFTLCVTSCSLTEHGMMLPNTHTLVLVWILLSMKVVDTMALAT